jgi:hypothetical protein
MEEVVVVTVAAEAEVDAAAGTVDGVDNFR